MTITVGRAALASVNLIIAQAAADDSVAAQAAASRDGMT